MTVLLMLKLHNIITVCFYGYKLITKMYVAIIDAAAAAAAVLQQLKLEIIKEQALKASVRA